MRLRRSRALPACAALGAAAVTLIGAGPALAADLRLSPKAVAPGEEVLVRGTCPDPVGDDFVRATVGAESLDRYVVVPVVDGRFRVSLTAAPAGAAAAPVAGERFEVVVSCVTAAAFVAPVGSQNLRIITPDRARARDAARAERGDRAADRQVALAAAAGPSVVTAGDGPVPAIVPLIAFAVAALGTVGAFALSRRSDRRAVAMAGHPAQRGLGRDPRRARK